MKPESSGSGRFATPLVGVLGGGQLGRMLGLAGIPLGCRFRFLDPSPDPPAAAVGEVVRAPWHHEEALEDFGRGLSVVTWEFENVPVEAVRALSAHTRVRPAPAALAVGQDRLAEKELFRRLGIGTAPFCPVDGSDELTEAARRIGLPAVLKTRRMGYDGKGQRVVRAPEALEEARLALGGSGLLLEGFVPFLRELSILVVRGADGETRFWPVGENVHREGILHTTRVPAPGLSPTRQGEAEAIARRIVEELGYVGVLAVELFETPDGLLANEIAPRVHNSGHWTQDGAFTSQFENHVRAILGLPLGRTEARGPSAMVNLVGALPDPVELVGLPGTHLHLYDKAPRPGRKLGHVNVVATTEGELEERLAQVLEVVEPVWMAGGEGDGSDGREGGDGVRERGQAAQASQRP